MVADSDRISFVKIGEKANDRNSLHMLLDDCDAERPQPSSLHRSAVLEGRAPELSAVGLVPRDAELAPVDAKKRVIGDAAVVDFLAKLNDSERH